MQDAHRYLSFKLNCSLHHTSKVGETSEHVERTAWENQSFEPPCTHRCFASLILFLTSASRRMVIAEFWTWRSVTCKQTLHSKTAAVKSMKLTPLYYFSPFQEDLRNVLNVKNSRTGEHDNLLTFAFTAVPAAGLLKQLRSCLQENI